METGQRWGEEEEKEEEQKEEKKEREEEEEKEIFRDLFFMSKENFIRLSFKIKLAHFMAI